MYSIWVLSRDPVEDFHSISDTENTVRMLKAFFSWRCDQQRGKHGRRAPGIKMKSSLETFWKTWYQVYKAEVGHGFESMTLRRIDDASKSLFAADLDTTANSL
jgi:hypothetical protein